MTYKNTTSLIAILLVFVAMFSHSSLKGQSLNETDGIAISYVWTIGDLDNVEVSNMTSMYYSEGNSIFFTSPFEGSSEFVTDDAGDMTAKVRMKTEEGQVYFIDRSARKIMAQELILDETANVEEDIPSFAWLMTGERKEIAEHNCYEATTSFRGRSYSAWFTPDIPLDVGPWKFSGLPGAILEVNDKEGRFNWYCKSIKELTSGDKLLIQTPQNKRVYSFNKYQDLLAERLVAHLNKIFSGSNVDVISEPNFDSWIERRDN